MSTEPLAVAVLDPSTTCCWCGCELTSDTRTFEHLWPAYLGGTRHQCPAWACKRCNLLRGSACAPPDIAAHGRTHRRAGWASLKWRAGVRWCPPEVCAEWCHLVRRHDRAQKVEVMDHPAGKSRKQKHYVAREKFSDAIVLSVTAVGIWIVSARVAVQSDSADELVAWAPGNTRKVVLERLQRLGYHIERVSRL